MKKHIPNILTSLNLFSGCIAVVMAFQGAYLWVVFWVVIAALFDFTDGFAARLLKAYSPMGKELDSLADMVSFGVSPSVAVYSLLSANIGAIFDNDIIINYLPFIAFLLAIFSALRLAKFNIDERQSEAFIGLNTPANAMFWTSLCYSLSICIPIFSSGIIYTIIVGVIVFSLLMVSEFPMFSFKIKSLKFKGNEYRYILFLFAIVALIIFKMTGISIIILFYIALSIIQNCIKKS